MFFTNQFVSLKTTDTAESFVGVGDFAAGIGDADDGVLIDSGFLPFEFTECAFEFALHLLPFIDQVTHQQREFFETCLIVRQFGEMGGSEQFVGRMAQGLYYGVLPPFLTTQLLVGLKDLFAADLQALVAQRDIGFVLLISIIHLTEQAIEAPQKIAGLLLQSVGICKSPEFQQRSSQLRLIRDTEKPF